MHLNAHAYRKYLIIMNIFLEDRYFRLDPFAEDVSTHYVFLLHIDYEQFLMASYADVEKNTKPRAERRLPSSKETVDEYIVNCKQPVAAGSNKRLSLTR